MNGFIVKRNKSIIIVLLLFATLFWIVTVQIKKGRFTILEKPVLAVSGVLERIITWPINTVVSIGRGYIFLVNTEQENQRLEKEIGHLKIETGATSELLLENDRLREMLNFKKLQPPSTIAVQVIGKELSPASNTITINKGSKDQIHEDMAVISADGVVGRVQTVLPDTSKVFLLTDPGSTIAVMVQRNREEGLLEGKLVKCAMKYVSYYADVQEGDLVVTSGLDGIYPKGLAVGTVTKVVKQEAVAFQTVVVEPAVRFSRLEEALVLAK